MSHPRLPGYQFQPLFVRMQQYSSSGLTNGGTCRDSYAYEPSPVKSASRNVAFCSALASWDGFQASPVYPVLM